MRFKIGLKLSQLSPLFITLSLCFTSSYSAAGCNEIFELVLSPKIDDALKNLIQKETLRRAERSFVTVNVTFRRPITSSKIKQNITNYNPKNIFMLKRTYDPEAKIVLGNDPFIINTISDLASMREVSGITLLASTENTNVRIDSNSTGRLPSEINFVSNLFDHSPRITVRFPKNFLGFEEIEQAATEAIATALTSTKYSYQKPPPTEVLVTMDYGSSSYDDDGSILTRGTSLKFNVWFKTSGGSNSQIAVDVNRNSITGLFDSGRVHY